MNNIVFASVISEIQQSPMFMTVKAVICDTPEANLNGAKVTEAFVNEVVKNEKRYVGLPLYADVKALKSGSYNRLGHLYDVKTGEFHSTQIGSFYKFEKEAFENGYHLIGYCRIPKRNKKVSSAISELFTQGRLKFSFEVSVGEYDENDDGTITIDASENNYLEGTAIVTYPACEDAVALELVAQRADAQEGGEQEMPKENLQEVAEQIVEEIKENMAEVTATPIEEAVAESNEAPAEETAIAAEEPVQDTSTADVYVVESKTEKNEIHAYDTETGKAVHQEIKVETTTEDRLDGTLVESEDGTHIAEEETKETAESGDNSGVVAEAGDDAAVDSPVETPEGQTSEAPANEPAPSETVTDEPAELEPSDYTADSTKKTAEQLIAELAAVVEKLSKEVEELKEKKVVAQTMTAEINPLMSDINTQKTYELLEKAEKSTNYQSLLEKY